MEFSKGHGKVRKFKVDKLIVRVYQEKEGPWILTYCRSVLEDLGGLQGEFYATSRKKIFSRLRVIISEKRNPKIKTVTSKLKRPNIAKAFEGIGIAAEDAAKAVKAFNKAFPNWNKRP